MKIILLCFLFIFFSCEKENFIEMKKSEKELLTQLKGNNIKNGNVSIDISNTYWYVNSNQAFPSIWSIVQINAFQISPNIQYSPNTFIFGFNDYQSNFTAARNSINEVISESQDIRITGKRDFDKNYFYSVKDNILKTTSYPINFNGLTNIDIPISSLNLAKYQKGDLILIRFSNSVINLPEKDFYIIETLIHCNELPYLNLCELINDSSLNIKSIKYDFSNKYATTFKQQSVPKQIELPISVLKTNIFGQDYLDSFNPLAFVPNSDYNTNKVLIPLKANGKNLILNIPLAFDIAVHNLTFSLSY